MLKTKIEASMFKFSFFICYSISYQILLRTVIKVKDYDNHLQKHLALSKMTQWICTDIWFDVVRTNVITNWKSVSVSFSLILLKINAMQNKMFSSHNMVEVLFFESLFLQSFFSLHNFFYKMKILYQIEFLQFQICDVL